MRVFGYDIRRPLWFLQKLGKEHWRAPSPVAVTEPYFVAASSGIALPPHAPARRNLPGPTNDLPADYEDRFDFASLFYDVFWDAGRVVLTGPPLANLTALVHGARISVDGAAVHGALRTTRKALTQLSWIEADTAPRELTFAADDWVMTVPVRATHHNAFQGRKVLLAISQDNDLNWISDWAEFHARLHGVDAVLMYDNGSTLYGPDDLLGRLKAVPGIAAAAVVVWPYRFGCHGRGFDGTYCQYTAIETARRRFLRKARGVLQIDVDELVVSQDGASLFDELERSSMGAILFEGVWIENIRERSDTTFRHRDFRHAGAIHKPTKWAAIPSMLPDGVQMKNHDFENGFKAPVSHDLRYRHFRAISTSWKYRRDRPESYDPAVHQLDMELTRDMRRIGWLDDADLLHHRN